MLSASDPEPYWGLFREAMRGLGYREGKDVLLESRSAGGKGEFLDRLARELVDSKVDVIVASQTGAVAAAKKATSTIPIVMAPAADPVENGLAASLARPAGNITGVASNSAEVAAKMFELIRELVRPRRNARVALLASANDPFTKTFLLQLQKAAPRMRTVVGVAIVRGPAQADAAFAEWHKLGVHAVVVQPGLPPRRAIDLGVQYRIPTVSTARDFVEAGGLASCSNSPREIAGKAASFVERIVRGARPGDLPLERATAFELVLNLKTARAIDLDFPESVMARADALVQ